MSVRQVWPVKKAMSICQSGWRKILNAFPVIRWVRWGPRTRSSALFRRRSKTGLRLRLRHRLRMLQHPITLTRKYSRKFVIKHLRRTNLGSTTLYSILQPKKLLHLFYKGHLLKRIQLTAFGWFSRRKNYRNSCCTPYCSMISPVLNVDEWRISLVQGRARLPPPLPSPAVMLRQNWGLLIYFFFPIPPPPPPPRMFPTPYLISIKTGSINDVTFF